MPNQEPTPKKQILVREKADTKCKKKKAQWKLAMKETLKSPEKYSLDKSPAQSSNKKKDKSGSQVKFA